MRPLISARAALFALMVVSGGLAAQTRPTYPSANCDASKGESIVDYSLTAWTTGSNTSAATPLTSDGTSIGLTFTIAPAMAYNNVSGNTYPRWAYAESSARANYVYVDFTGVTGPAAMADFSVAFSRPVRQVWVDVIGVDGSNTGGSRYRDAISGVGAAGVAQWVSGNGFNTVSGNAITGTYGNTSCSGSCLNSQASMQWDNSSVLNSVTLKYASALASGVASTDSQMAGFNRVQACVLPYKVKFNKIWGANTPAGTATTLTLSGGSYAGSAVSGSSTSGGAATTATMNAKSGDSITLAESALTGYAKAFACTRDSNGATITVSGGGFTMPASSDVTCTVTNTPNADLSITKKTNTSPVISGQPVSYTLAIANAGPASATGAVVKDIPGSGITCPGANIVTCSGTGCPGGGITVGNLLSPGVTMGAMAAGTSATLTYACTAN